MTDDLAYRDAEGWWWYRGRADDVIVTAGYNVGPGEVEAAHKRQRLEEGISVEEETWEQIVECGARLGCTIA